MANPWIKAVRLRTLPLAGASLTMGAALADMQGAFTWLVYVLSILTAFCLQILSNLANDYGDAVSGLDGENRVGPSRTIQEGLITKSQMKGAIGLMAVFSFVFGLTLIYVALGDWQVMLIFLGIGLVSILAAVKYTMGDNPYGYSGWGDVFVLVFFGWIGVSGSLYLYSNSFEILSLLPATALGLMAVGVLNVNNIRDIESDRVSGKFSIPVRLGRKLALRYHGIILISSVSCMFIYAVIQQFEGFQWSFMLVLPLFIKNWNGVSASDEAVKIDPFLKQMAVSTMVFVILFLLGNVVFA